MTMTYTVYDSDGESIAVGDAVTIETNGILAVRDSSRGIDAIFAPGAWASAIWDDED